MLKTKRFHSIFHLSEDDSREVFSPFLEMHVLELSKLGLAAPERQDRLSKWARFLRAKTPEELERLAAEDTIMTAAKQALELMSADAVLRRRARDRETSMRMHRHLLAASREAGEAKGLAKGLAKGMTAGEAKGRAEGLRVAVHSLCTALQLELAEERLGKLEAPELTRLVDFITTNRRLPDGF